MGTQKTNKQKTQQQQQQNPDKQQQQIKCGVLTLSTTTQQVVLGAVFC